MSKRHVGTVLGKELFDFGDVDGDAADVLLQHPLGLTVADATIYIADTYNHKIKAVDMAKGAVTTTLAGGEGILCEPSDVDVSGPFLVVADTGNHRLRVLDRAEGQVRTVVIKGL
jgi:DNA-binding beta-propeller fold protein YncE